MAFEAEALTALAWSTPAVTEIEGPEAVDMRDRAVALARLGLKVFKLDPYSHRPIAPRFWEQASDDPDRVYRMWTAHDGSSEPHDPGVLTGDGYVVIDVDVKGGKPGDDSLFVLEQCSELDIETLTASTPSGGKHLFYRVPAGLWWTNRQGKKALRPGIDLKGTHGYVVGVGATRPDGSRYDWLNRLPMLELPQWLQEEIGRPLGSAPGSREAFQLAIRTPDDEWAYEAAAAYLTTAPAAIEGANGHDVIVEVANRCMDFGLTPDGTVEAMLEHWAERCSRVPEPDWLAYQVHSLRGSRQQPIGVSHPLGRTRVLDAFERVQLRRREDEGSKLTNDPEWPRPSLLLPYDPGDVPPRRFIVPKFIARQFVTGFVSPGGTGKTSFLAAMMLAVGTGDGSAIGQEVIDRTRVWYWNQEDNLDELKRRLGAVIVRHGLAWADMRDRLYLDSGADKPLFIATRRPGGLLQPTAQVEKVIKHIREQEIGLFMIDPLVEFHEGEENDNPQMRLVWATARRIAVEGDCAVLVATHSRKPPQASSDGFAGDQDSFRGASSQTGVMRLGFTMFGMSERDAKHYGVHERDRHLYVRVDDAKSNLTLKGPDPLWLKRISVNTGREEVGVLEPVELNRQSGRADLIELLASAASTEFESLGGVFDRLDDEDRARFGEASHLSRTLKKALNDAGAVVDEKGIWTVLAEAGKTEIVFRVGKPGSLIKCVAN